MKRITMAALLALPVSVFAEDIDHVDSGNYFHEVCATKPEICTNFVKGVMEGNYYVIGVAKLAQSYDDAGKVLGYCPPSSVRLSRFTDVFINFLKNNPEQRHQQAATLAIASWMQAWPCE